MHEQRNNGAVEIGNFGDLLVELILRYRGPLVPSNGRRHNLALKEQIREFLHPQLKYHWANDPYLRSRIPQESKIGDSFYGRDVGGVLYVPLVIDKPAMKLICELTIGLAIRNVPGGVLRHNGDIDNKIKTLLDALRMPDPRLQHEWPKSPAALESPFFCLLENDSLITKLSISAERNLEAPMENERETDVLATIDAAIRFNPYSHPFGTYASLREPF